MMFCKINSLLCDKDLTDDGKLDTVNICMESFLSLVMQHSHNQQHHVFKFLAASNKTILLDSTLFFHLHDPSKSGWDLQNILTIISHDETKL